MQLHRVFDFIGPTGFIPNGMNYNYTADLWDTSYTPNNVYIDNFAKKYLQVSVYDCHLNIGPNSIVDLHINDIHYSEESNLINQGKENYFYTITPFGNVLVATGQDFTYHQNKHVFDFISDKAKKYLKADNFYLIFDYSSEGDIKPEIFYNIHEACETHNIDPAKVIFITSAVNTTDLYNDYYVKEKKPTSKLKTTCYLWPIYAKGKETADLVKGRTELTFSGISNTNSITKLKDIVKLKNREKKCLILNRRLRPHRLILLSLLQSDKLLDDTLSSFDMDLLYTKDAGLDLVMGGGYDGNPYIEDQQIKNKMSTGFRGLTKIKKRTVDYDDINSVWGFAFENKEPYEQTYFSVIPETLFYEAGNYISEKTLKPIAHLHPFVMLGRPHLIKKLKQLGFKTFSEFWDESYDDIENNSERILKIYEVVKSLVEKPNEEWDIMMQKLYPILEFNRLHLMKFNDKLIPNTYIKNLNKLINGESVDLL